MWCTVRCCDRIKPTTPNGRQPISELDLTFLSNNTSRATHSIYKQNKSRFARALVRVTRFISLTSSISDTKTDHCERTSLVLFPTAFFGGPRITLARRQGRRSSILSYERCTLAGETSAPGVGSRPRGSAATRRRGRSTRYNSIDSQERCVWCTRDELVVWQHKLRLQIRYEFCDNLKRSSEKELDVLCLESAVAF